jgi:hypothetical protein
MSLRLIVGDLDRTVMRRRSAFHLRMTWSIVGVPLMRVSLTRLIDLVGRSIALEVLVAAEDLRRWWLIVPLTTLIVSHWSVGVDHRSTISRIEVTGVTATIWNDSLGAVVVVVMMVRDHCLPCIVERIIVSATTHGSRRDISHAHGSGKEDSKVGAHD